MRPDIAQIDVRRGAKVYNDMTVSERSSLEGLDRKECRIARGECGHELCFCEVDHGKAASAIGIVADSTQS